MAIRFVEFSNRGYKIRKIFALKSTLGFPTGRDSKTFWDSGTAKNFLSRDKGTTGQKFLHCSGTKGQRDKLKILPRDGTGQPKFGNRRAGTAKIQDGARDKMGQSRKVRSKTGEGCSKAGNPVSFLETF